MDGQFDTYLALQLHALHIWVDTILSSYLHHAYIRLSAGGEKKDGWRKHGPCDYHVSCQCGIKCVR
jgi:hypothetical protein